MIERPGDLLVIAIMVLVVVILAVRAKNGLGVTWAEWLGLIDDDDTPNIEGTYYLHGGHSYALPTFPLSDEESFDTLEDAWAEWLDRRSNQRQFPCWGDSGPDEPAIILGDEAETYGAWTPREASAELPDYDDIDDIYNPEFWG